MIAYIAKRLLATVPVLAIVAVLVFSMLRFTPGDPAAIIAGSSATTQDVIDIRQKLGLDQPVTTQFYIWMTHLARGDLGGSFFFKKPVAELVRDRLEPTLALATTTMLLSILIAVPL